MDIESYRRTADLESEYATDRQGRFFWYLVKGELASVRYYIPVYWTSHFLQGSRNTRPCKTGHPACKMN